MPTKLGHFINVKKNLMFKMVQLSGHHIQCPYDALHRLYRTIDTYTKGGSSTQPLWKRGTYLLYVSFMAGVKPDSVYVCMYVCMYAVKIGLNLGLSKYRLQSSPYSHYANIWLLLWELNFREQKFSVLKTTHLLYLKKFVQNTLCVKTIVFKLI